MTAQPLFSMSPGGMKGAPKDSFAIYQSGWGMLVLGEVIKKVPLR